MTAKDRVDLWVALGRDISNFLAHAGGPMDAGTLVREFCKVNNVALADAEVALSLLLNQRDVIVDSDMRLEHNARAAA
jgi:hypothetical protein